MCLFVAGFSRIERSDHVLRRIPHEVVGGKGGADLAGWDVVLPGEADGCEERRIRDVALGERLRTAAQERRRPFAFVVTGHGCGVDSRATALVDGCEDVVYG